MQQLSYGVLQEVKEGRSTMSKRLPVVAPVRSSIASQVRERFVPAREAKVYTSIISPEEKLRREIWQPAGFRPPWGELDEEDMLQDNRGFSAELEALSEQQQQQQGPAPVLTSLDTGKSGSAAKAHVKGRGPQPKG
jgi:hypothetical protein